MIFCGEVDGAGGVEFVLRGAVGLQLGDLLPEGGFEVFELDAGLGGDGALDDGGELEGVVAAADGLCDLLSCRRGPGRGGWPWLRRGRR